MPDRDAPTDRSEAASAALTSAIDNLRAQARGDRFHGTADDFDPPADVPVAVDAGLDVLVGRFNLLSDTAGNPGAPRATHWDASNPPPIPDPAPGPGVYEATELARAAAPHYGPDPVSAYHLLNQRIDTLTAKLDDLAAKQAEDLGAILARLPLNPAETEPWTCPECGQATLMPAAEGAPTEEDNRPPPATRPDLVIAEATIHVLRTRLHPAAFRGIADSDLAFEIAAAAVKALEDAPTEGPGRGRGPLIPSENWTSTDPAPARPNAAGFLPHGTRVRHPRFGPATVSATAWTPDEGYTAQVEWDVDPGGGTKAWVDSTTLTLLTEEGA